jgi:hypothetical protein
MTMKSRVDIDEIAKGLGAERRGSVGADSGFFGAAQLVADVQARFRVPKGGGRATDPAWSSRRLLPLAEQSLRRLEGIADAIEQRRQVHIDPMQVAALLLERTLEQVTDEEAENIIPSKVVPSR